MVVDETGVVVSDVSETLASVLQRSGAVSAASLADTLSLDVSAVRASLEQLVCSGSVEVLRPIQCTPWDSDPELEYYRWRRCTDEDYVWQSLLTQSAATPEPALERRLALLVDY